MPRGKCPATYVSSISRLFRCTDNLTSHLCNLCFNLPSKTLKYKLHSKGTYPFANWRSFQGEAGIYSAGPGFIIADISIIEISFLYNFAMFSPILCLLFLPLKTICSTASSNLDTPAAEFSPSPEFELNSIGLPSEAQDGAKEWDVDATTPSYPRESFEAPLITQGVCTYDYNQKSRRHKARSQRAGSSCSPMINRIQDETITKKTRPGFQWQTVPQSTENGSGTQKPEAPYSDESRCPRTAPFPVCAFSTVATIRPDPSYPDTDSTAGRWILDYCRCKYFYPLSIFAIYFSPRKREGQEIIRLICPNDKPVPKLESGCDRNAGEGFWCCQFASEVNLFPPTKEECLQEE